MGVGPERTLWNLVLNVVVVMGHIQLLTHQTVL